MKLIPALTAMLLALSPAAVAQTASVALIDHNIHSGGRPEEAAASIVNLMEMTPQKMIVQCQEANYARQYFDFNYPDWHIHWPGSPFEGKGNPIFVRDAAATMLSHWVMAMTEPWTHLQPKDPRVFTGVKCQLVANPWVTYNCINVHFPTNKTGNEAARQEAVDRLIEFSDDNPDLPLIICGDFNMSEDNARRRIANAIGGKLYSNASVDHIILRDGTNVAFDTNVTVKRLGDFGSDHQALRYNFDFIQLNSQVADWTLY